MGFCRLLCVLLWKHMLVRKRRYLHTIAELVSPLFLIILVYYIYTLGISPNTLSETALKQFQSLSRVLYTPYTALTSVLMSEVGKSMKLSEREGEPNNFTSGYWGVNNKSVLENFMETMNNNDAVIIFHNLDGDTMPHNLNYTIRMKEPFLTNTVKSLDYTPTPHSSFGDIYALFMNLQWAVDKSYLKLRTGSDLDQKVTFQEFPHMRTNENELVRMTAVIMYIQAFTSLTMLMPFLFQVIRLLEERASGVVELIKIVGVTSKMVGFAHFLNAVPCALVFAALSTVILTALATPILPNTGFGFIFVAMFLYYCSIMALAYPVSYIMKTTNHITIICVICYIMLWLPGAAVFKTFQAPLLYLTGFLPFVPMYWFFEEICMSEVMDESLQISDILVKQMDDSAPIIYALLFVNIQIVLCFPIAWYLDKVRPGAYGVALPWNFLFKKSYWSKKVDPALIAVVDKSEEDPRYFEPPSKYLKAGIEVIDVTKIFGTWYGPKNTALSHLTVNFYEGEITVLLGHNGAGKTTLMSIITGMISSTQGTVLVKGMDNIKNREKVRRHLGFCPQNNMCFTDLTVWEHIMIFAMFKGLNYTKARIASDKLIEKLNLEGKEKFKSAQLSGGMKRRLQLACALAGNASVLILDEPTSGLDVETRRELWNLLLKFRGTCTVVISTHFMEEADALGDRVVAIHQGKLRCGATPMYLKKAVGTGYRLSLTLNKSAKESAITIAITKHIANAYISDRTSTSVSYKLPATGSDSFPKLFNELESRRKELGIETIGVGVTTLDEVFLKLCSDVNTDEEIEQHTGHVDAVSFKKVSGFPLCFRILKVLIKRQLIATWDIKWHFLLIQLFVPIFCICLLTAFMKGEGKRAKPPTNIPPSLMLNLDAYKDTGMDSVLLDMSEKESLRHLRTVIEDFPDFELIKSTNVSEVLRTGREKYLIGLETNSTNVNLRYTTLLRHAAPVALNLYSNLRALELLPTSTAARTITTYNHPMESKILRDNKNMVETKQILTCHYWSLVVTFMVMTSLVNEANLPCRERIQGARYIQIMAGCSPVLYWLVTLIHDYAIYLIFIVLISALACLLLDEDKLFSAPDFVSTFVVILMLGGLAFLLFVYFMSFFYNDQMVGVAIMMVLFIFGFILPFGYIALFESILPAYVKYVKPLFMILPPYPFATASIQAVTTARANNVCRLNVGLCPNLVENYSVDFATVCCTADLTSKSGPFPYWVSKSGFTEIIILVLQIVVYGSLVILCEYGLLGALYSKILNKKYQPQAKLYHDELALQEEKYCQKCVLKGKKIEDAALVHDLHKVYKHCCRKPMNAVRGISFSVTKGECFGLLGVNGAGKSTTFKMLTGEEACTRGTMFVNGYSVSQRAKYKYSMAYCPQFGGLDMFLTGEQNLKQLLVIRGLNDSDVNKEAKTWLGYVGLEQYTKRKASKYSGGCLRRLAAAVALSSGAPISLLDEPTTGVDTAARRRVWIALKRGLAQKRSIIITSHSMDEMEALCNRIAIMNHGEICALGAPPALRAAHGVGLSLRLKLKPLHKRKGEAAASKSSTPVQNMKADLKKTYPGKVRDEHSTMLFYHINKKVPYSEIFQYMEQLKITYDEIIEDYSVTETTLEEVFLSFARDEASSKR